jgi:ABC-2 type transport system ATP-binding protein
MLATIECSGLGKSYRGTVALADLSLEVQEGEVFGLLGPNGAGKTTLFRLLLGLTGATKGSARVLGTGVPVGARTLARIGAIVEEPALYPWMNARQFLATMSDTRVASVSRRARDETLERVGLEDAGRKRIGKYSQGMRQRLGLAQALMGKPELLILDEPANGLDPAGIEWLRRLLKEEATAGTTVMVSSHQLGEIERVCDRVGILSNGKLLEVGSTDGVGGASQRVRIEVTAKDRAATAKALAHLRTVEVGAGVFFVEDSNNKDVGALLMAARVMPETLVRESSSLEQRFLQVTGVRP